MLLFFDSLGSTTIDGVNPEVSDVNPEVNNIPAVDHRKQESGDEAGNSPCVAIVFFTPLPFSSSDPPDEIIPKLGPTPLPPNFTQPTIQPSSSILIPVVSRFAGDKLWRLRTVLTVLCALIAVVVEVSLGLVYSNVVLMLVLDLTLLLYIFFMPHTSNQNVNEPLYNPLGKLSLLKVPLTLVSSSWANWFDPVCLCVMLTGYVFRDLLIMIFLTIVFKLCITLVT